MMTEYEQEKICGILEALKPHIAKIHPSLDVLYSEIFEEYALVVRPYINNIHMVESLDIFCANATELFTAIADKLREALECDLCGVSDYDPDDLPYELQCSVNEQIAAIRRDVLSKVPNCFDQGEFGYSVRKLDSEDLPSVIELDALCEFAGAVQEELSSLEFGESSSYAYGLFEKTSQKLIGYCTIGGADILGDDLAGCYPFYMPDSLLLSDVFIRPDYRRKGLGLMLCQYAIAHAATKPGQSVFLTTVDDEVCNFYSKLGFQTVESYDYTMCRPASGCYTHVSDILWDSDDYSGTLPSSVNYYFADADINDDELSELISERLSDDYGFCPEGFRMDLYQA